MKKRPGDKCSARYEDRFWYPARIESVHPDHVIVRWDPPDPNIPATYRVDDPEEDLR